LGARGLGAGGALLCQRRGSDTLVVDDADGGGRFGGGITKFGRNSSRRASTADLPMNEPIASRSHFSIIYDQPSDRYKIMDAGSKWGTFVKIGSSVTLSCGDWIRVGGVEFIIRYFWQLPDYQGPFVSEPSHSRGQAGPSSKDEQSCSQPALPVEQRIVSFQT